MEPFQFPVAEPFPAMEPLQAATVVTAEPLPVAPQPVPQPMVSLDTQLDLKDFTSVQVNGPMDVTIAQGPFSVKVESDVNVVDLVEVTVEKGTLKIECTRKGDKKNKDCKCDLDKLPNVVVAMPELRAVGLRGSGVVSIGDLEQTGTMDLALAGSGDIRFSSLKGLTALGISVAGSGTISGEKAEITGKTRISVAGSGDVKIAGRTEKVEIGISGSGDVDASDLKAESGVANISGSGNASVNTKGQLTKAISGSGKVRNTGSGGSGSSSPDEDQQ
ncbi:MAG: head GIN domain-containing protein [Flavobacteriales bacterium]